VGDYPSGPYLPYLLIINQKLKKMKMLKTIGLMLVASLIVKSSFAQQMGTMEKTVEVGGAMMYPSKNIVENAVNSKDHTTLVAAVKAAGLVDVLQSAGPFTVFAPVNAAFSKLPAGTVETLLKPENKATLTAVLTYHVVAGRISAAELMQKIKAGKGKAMLTTVQGGMLTVMMKGKKIVLKDEKGGTSTITIKDVNQSNGVIHVVDSVVLPGK
jgi:uncharacterized surface protein with fasciclin (FAS1) repeats